MSKFKVGDIVVGIRESGLDHAYELNMLIKKANAGLEALETLALDYYQEIIWRQVGSQSGWYLSGGNLPGLPRVKKKA